MNENVKDNWFAIKENRLKLIEFPFQRFNFLIISSTVLWVTYLHYSSQYKGIANSITNILSKYWIKPILSKIGTGDIPLWCIIGLTFLIGLYFTGKALRKYVYSGKSILFYSFLVVNYMMLRFVPNTYELARLADEGIIKYVAYWDLIFLLLIPICFRFIKWCFCFIKIQNLINRGLVLIVPICNKIKRTYKCFFKKKNSNTEGSDLILERELTDKADDTLNRANIAKQIASILDPIEPEKSFAVGITAPWGNGKTSFLNFLILELKERDDKTIFIKFSPWSCKSKIDIISLFFDSLSEGLKPYHSSINNQIEKYAKLLLAAHKNQVSETINKAFDLFSSSKDVRSIYEQINASIGDLNSKVYITIDDLDRLYAKEIIECFKIIRNTANFKNVIFIVAYDPSYVDNALAQGLKNNHKGYIDKIIQLPFNLPQIEKYKLLNYIVSELKKRGVEGNIILKYEYYKNSEIDNRSSNKNHELDISEYFTNLRDCNKILNIFFTYQKLLGDEVIQSDLFLVCLFKTLYPKEALEIYSNLDEYFTFGNQIQLKDLDQLKNWAIKQKDKTAKLKPRYSIKELNDDKDFLNLVQAVFLVSETNIRSAARHNNFETYYNGVVSEEKIKYADFEKWIKSDEILINKIQELDDDGSGINDEKLNNLALKLSNFTPKYKIQAQIILQGIFYLDRDLNTVISLLFSFKDDYYDILNQVINSELDIPLKGIARKIADIKFGIIDSGTDSDYKRVFEFEKIQDLSVKVLEKKIATELVDTDLLDVYWNCAIERTDGPLKIDIKANELMKKFAEVNAVEFIKILEITPHHVRDNETRAFHYSIDQIFSNKIGNYDGFEEFLKKVVADNSKNQELQKIWSNWEQFKDSNYKSYKVS